LAHRAGFSQQRTKRVQRSLRGPGLLGEQRFGPLAKKPALGWIGKQIEQNAA
jgi:hypothetical protein